MKKIGVLSIFLVLSLFLMISVFAQPPFQQEAGELRGLTLRFPPVDVIKANETVTANMHVYNATDGLLLKNDTVQCFADLYNFVGDHLIEKKEMNFRFGGNDFTQVILGSNFSEIGRHSFIIWCNSTTAGGFVSGAFEVTPTGFILETSESILYIIILISTFILFLAFLYPTITLPYSNRTEPDGSITKITKAKYLKLLSFWFAYGFLMWFLQTLNAISTNYITLTYLSNFITNIFTYSQAFSVGITFLILFIIMIEVWKDIILSKTIKKFGKAFSDGRLQ